MGLDGDVFLLTAGFLLGIYLPGNLYFGSPVVCVTLTGSLNAVVIAAENCWAGR